MGYGTHTKLAGLLKQVDSETRTQGAKEYSHTGKAISNSFPTLEEVIVFQESENQKHKIASN